MLLKNLKADQLPSIDLKKLLMRFSDELQLPSDYYFSINNFLIIIFIIFITMFIFLIRRFYTFCLQTYVIISSEH